MKDGKGITTLNNGQEYEGTYKEDNKHGKFIFTNKKGRSSERHYKDDKRITKKRK